MDGADPLGQVVDVVIAAIGCEVLQRHVEAEEVVGVGTAGPGTGGDVLSQGLRVLRSDKLLVVWCANVDEGVDGRRLGLGSGWVRVRGAGGSRVEWSIVDGVAVYLADVEVLLDLCHAFRLDAVGHTPDAVGRRVVVVGEGGPVGALNEGDDAAGGFGGAAVVFAARARASARVRGQARVVSRVRELDGGGGGGGDIPRLPKAADVAIHPPGDSPVCCCQRGMDVRVCKEGAHRSEEGVSK